MGKKYKHFSRTDHNTPETKHQKKTDVAKRITNKQFLPISVHTDSKSNKEAIFQQKIPKSTHSWSNHFWNPIANVSVKVQYEKASI